MSAGMAEGVDLDGTVQGIAEKDSRKVSIRMEGAIICTAVVTRGPPVFAQHPYTFEI
jgi:hypothetical protein